MDILRHVSLKAHNTLGIAAEAGHMVKVSKRIELLNFIKKFLPDLPKPLLVLGEGSNILFTGDFEGTIIKLENKGIYVLEESENDILVKVEAGENWNDFVEYCIANDWGGLENLIMIPGKVGSSPIQNIGAYGVEMKDCFHSLEALNLETYEILDMNREECKFGYRDSVFKNEYKGKYIILSVTFRLTKAHNHNISYKSLKAELNAMGVRYIGIQEVAEAVIRLRKRKIPDPKILPNAGSFFKNPVISAFQFYQLKNKFPDIVHFNQLDGTYKIAAGWLIEKCGWKGYRRGDAGVHSEQALILVNYGKATGMQILELANDIRKSVYETFGIELETEVNII